jgi:hypothetical protein
MKTLQTYLLPFFLILLVQTGRAQVVLFTEGFETDGEGTRYTSNTFSFCSGVPGNNPDYFLRINTNPVLPAGCSSGFANALTNLQGSFFWASEDIRSSSPVPNANPPGQITTQSINISGYGSLGVSLFLATSSNNNVRWEIADSINIQASINGGAYFTVGRFMGDNVVGGRLRIDANLDGAITAADPATTCDQLNFTQYNFSIPGSGTSLRIRLDFDQIGGTEELGIDQLRVTGISVLPVKLVYFNAALRDNSAAVINWKTAAGSDAAYFEIEKSNDGTNFSVLKTVNAGLSDKYSEIDPNLFSGPCFYRLKMTDTHGAVSYSGVVALHKKTAGFVIKSIMPNPVRDNASIVFISPSRISGIISAWNTEGKIMLQAPVSIQSGQTIQALPLEKLSPGFYIVKITDLQGTVLGATKLLKQ